MRPVVVTATVDDDELAALRRPQDHYVLERPEGPDRFGLDVGPFTRWERRVEVGPPTGDGRHRVTTTVDGALAVGLWAPLFVPLLRWNLRRTAGAGRRPAWMPPRLDARSATTMGALAVFALYGGYLGVLLSQTNAFFKAEFGASSSEIADAQIAVRIGAFAALAVAALADRIGRRRVVLASAVLGIALAATGALAPNLTAITVSQGAARAFSTALLVVIGLMAAEEVAAGARALAVSVLTMVGGVGAGGVVALLWVAGLSPGAWRLLYLVPLPFLATVPALARRLPETRRYEVHDLRVTEGDDPEPAPGERAAYRRWLVLVGALMLCSNLYSIPFAGFTNDYLLNERSFAAWQVTVFQLVTNLPAGATIAVGGRLADLHGRRRVGTVGLVGGAVFGLGQFLTDGWPLWVCSTLTTIFAGLVVPSVLVYQTELFPTRWRGRAQGLVNLAAVAGAVTGLKVVGVLADRYGSFGPAVAAVSVAPVAMVVILLVWFPETSGIELEDLNPGDPRPPQGDELARLDRHWEDRREGGHHHAVHEHEP